MPDQESIQFDVDPRSVLGAIKQMNAAMESMEKGSTSANAAMQKAIERTSDILLKVNDRSRTSMDRLVQSIEKQAAAYGRTNAERMVAERDRIIKKLGDEQGMIERVNTAYAKMLASDATGRASAGIETMGASAHEAKASLALMGEEVGLHIPRHLRTFITMLPGVGQALEASFKAVAVIALIAVIYEAVKKVLELRKAIEDMHVAAERSAAEFARFNDSQKLANDELKVTNDRLENAIAKLAHKLLARVHTLPPSQVYSFAGQICQGFRAIHAANIIHRDLKPGNLLIRNDGAILVSDFGLARSVMPQDFRFSQTGESAGTPR